MEKDMQRFSSDEARDADMDQVLFATSEALAVIAAQLWRISKSLESLTQSQDYYLNAISLNTKWRFVL